MQCIAPILGKDQKRRIKRQKDFWIFNDSSDMLNLANPKHPELTDASNMECKSWFSNHSLRGRRYRDSQGILRVIARHSLPWHGAAFNIETPAGKINEWRREWDHIFFKTPVEYFILVADLHLNLCWKKAKGWLH